MWRGGGRGGGMPGTYRISKKKHVPSDAMLFDATERIVVQRACGGAVVYGGPGATFGRYRRTTLFHSAHVVIRLDAARACMAPKARG